MSQSVVTVSYADEAFSGLWHVTHNVLHVESAYGLAWTPIGTLSGDPGQVAERVLTDLVYEWLAGSGSALH